MHLKLSNINQWHNNVANYLTTHDEWYYFGCVIVISLMQLSSPNWENYGLLLLNNAFLALPMLIFSFLTNDNFKHSLHRKYYGLFWLLLFVCYPLFAIYNSHQNILFTQFLINDGELFILIGVVSILVKLESSVFKIDQGSHVFSRINIELLVLVIASILVVYISMLIVSDLTLWSSSNRLADSISLIAVKEHFPLFIGIVIQLALLLAIPYLLYLINFHILVKFILTTRGTISYIFSVITSTAFLYPILTGLYLLLPINYMGSPIIPANTPNPFAWDNARVIIAIFAISFPLILVIQLNKLKERNSLLSQSNIENELELLKQQINPHFLFNTLNNLYALTRKKSEKAPDVVIQLSDLMRYVVYDAQQDYVRLEQEWNYLMDYIELQSIRLAKKLVLTREYDVNNDVKIVPLLFIILVENAFKHGIDNASEHCSLDVALSTTQDQITFICVNSIDNTETTRANDSDGVGLINLKKRLQLLYPNKHKLLLQNTGNKFIAELSIEL